MINYLLYEVGSGTVVVYGFASRRTSSFVVSLFGNRGGDFSAGNHYRGNIGFLVNWIGRRTNLWWGSSRPSIGCGRIIYYPIAVRTHNSLNPAPQSAERIIAVRYFFDIIDLVTFPSCARSNSLAHLGLISATDFEPERRSKEDLQCHIYDRESAASTAY
ncbi:hypothetical protein BH24ACI3_BH24ACI3_09970 [soil metagenome]